VRRAAEHFGRQVPRRHTRRGAHQFRRGFGASSERPTRSRSWYCASRPHRSQRWPPIAPKWRIGSRATACSRDPTLGARHAGRAPRHRPRGGRWLALETSGAGLDRHVRRWRRPRGGPRARAADAGFVVLFGDHVGDRQRVHRVPRHRSVQMPRRLGDIEIVGGAPAGAVRPHPRHGDRGRPASVVGDRSVVAHRAAGVGAAAFRGHRRDPAARPRGTTSPCCPGSPRSRHTHWRGRRAPASWWRALRGDRLPALTVRAAPGERSRPRAPRRRPRLSRARVAWGAALDPAELVAGVHGTVDQRRSTSGCRRRVHRRRRRCHGDREPVWGWRDTPISC